MPTKSIRDWDSHFTEVSTQGDVRSIRSDHVWTEVGDGNKIYLVPGHHQNYFFGMQKGKVLGYRVTKEAWKDQDSKDQWRVQ